MKQILVEQDFLNAIDTLKIQNSSVLIHSSMKSFGAKIDGNANTIINAFLKRNCTIITPSFTYDNEISPALDILQNGIGDGSYYKLRENLPIKCFDVNSKDLSVEHMGIFAKTVLQNENSIRGNHALNSFTALGENAKALVKDQNNKDVYAPLKKLCEDDGYVLLMGTSLESATIIHYAEQLAGRTLFVRWAYDKNKKPIPLAVGSCSDGFDNLYGVLKDYASEITVGSSKWFCYKAKDIVKVCADYIKKHPEITHCNNKNCDRCNDAILGGPILNKDFWKNI